MTLPCSRSQPLQFRLGPLGMGPLDRRPAIFPSQGPPGPWTRVYSPRAPRSLSGPVPAAHCGHHKCGHSQRTGALFPLQFEKRPTRNLAGVLRAAAFQKRRGTCSAPAIALALSPQRQLAAGTRRLSSHFTNAAASTCRAGRYSSSCLSLPRHFTPILRLGRCRWLSWARAGGECTKAPTGHWASNSSYRGSLLVTGSLHSLLVCMPYFVAPTNSRCGYLSTVSP